VATISKSDAKLRTDEIMLVALAFGLNSFEQLRVGSFEVVRKFHSCL